MPKQDRPVGTGPRCSLCAKESTGLDELFGDPPVCCGTPSLGVGRLSAAFPRDGPPTPEKELSTDGGLILPLPYRERGRRSGSRRARLSWGARFGLNNTRAQAGKPMPQSSLTLGLLTAQRTMNGRQLSAGVLAYGRHESGRREARHRPSQPGRLDCSVTYYHRMRTLSPCRLRVCNELKAH